MAVDYKKIGLVNTKDMFARAIKGGWAVPAFNFKEEKNSEFRGDILAMSIDLMKRLGIFVVLVLVQGLVFNHIHLFNCATPLLYIIMVLHFRRNHPRWAVLLWCFMMGLCIDVFANTPGVATASMTLVGLLQPYLFELFVPRDSADDLEPSVRTIGMGSYFLYVLIIVLVYNLLFFTLETFNFFNWMQWLMCIGGSTVITMVMVMAIEGFRK